jgi:hypothetical protein
MRKCIQHAGPFLFDTSAECWLARKSDPAVRAWWREYLSRFPVNVSAVTVIERVRGYALLWRRGGSRAGRGRAGGVLERVGAGMGVMARWLW